MTSLASKLTAIVSKAFEEAGLPAEFGLVRVSDRPDLAQFQCNGAMAAAKVARKNPRAVAEDIAGKLAKRAEFSKVEIAGPGFINLNLTPDYIAQNLHEMAVDERLGVPELVHGQSAILDYGGMNVAKAMHVGHMRPTVIGDCLKKIMRFAGYKALGDIHLGDWGLQMGQIISEFEIRHPEWPYFDPDFEGPYPDEAPFTYDQLEKIYPEASAACKEDKDRLERARKATAELQQGRPGYRALWRQFLALSIDDLKAVFGPLGVEFDLWKGESDVEDIIPGIGEDLIDRGIAVKHEGAVVIEVAEEGDNKQMPPLMFYKSDGAVTYGTTDLATIYDRVKTYPDVTKIVYVVDKRQSLHFEQVFRSAKKAGYGANIEFKHVAFGTLNGPDGKPFKTRQGGMMKFAALLETAIEKAAQRLAEADLAQDMPQEEKGKIALQVAVAALKFAELSNQPHMDYIFDLERMVSFEGKTGPYLLYQAVRIKSLLRKAEERGFAPGNSFTLREEDKTLALLLAELPDVFEGALNNYTPHLLCDYAYRLAQTFSSFYNSCHILSEEDEALRASRLALCALTLAQMEMVLSLLGIGVPERM